MKKKSNGWLIVAAMGGLLFVLNLLIQNFDTIKPLDYILHGLGLVVFIVTLLRYFKERKKEQVWIKKKQ